MFTSYVLTREGKEDITVWRFDEAPIPEFSKDLICCLDTETSKKLRTVYVLGKPIEEPEAVWVYQWAIRIGPTYVYGRTVDDLLTYMERLREAWWPDKRGKTDRLIIFVHNLSYDMSYIIMKLYELHGEKVKIFALNSRKYLKVTIPGFEFRCSYRLKNKSLASWVKDENLFHMKAVGAIDYDTIRYPDEELTDDDWYYQFSDVASMYDGIAKCLERDTMSTLPLTSTGYVRRDLRQASETAPGWRKTFDSIKPNSHTYPLMRRAFTGGWTHANYYYTYLQHDVEGVDATSMYPAVIATEDYPIGKFYKVLPKDGQVEKTRVQRYLDEGFACLFDVYITHMEMKRDANGEMGWNPYIAFSKCKTCLHQILDNGKILSADYVYITVTELDWKWITKLYNIDDWAVTDMYISRKGKLPKWFIKQVERWFLDKSLLKTDQTEEGRRRYSEAKERLNSLYGLLATDPIRDGYELDFKTGVWHEVNNHHIDKYVEMEQRHGRSGAHGAKDQFLPYQWGIWTTAHARDRLFTAMQYCRKPLYCDTDSIKGCDWDWEGLEAYNHELAEKSRAAGNFDITLPNGKRTILGVFTDDGYYKEFKALHAKCYAYVTADDQLHVVVAGVTKRGKDGKTKEEELGCIENLQNGFRFVSCGGTRSKYVDLPHSVDIDGHHIDSYGGCAIMDTTYLVGDGYSTEEFIRLFEISCK